METNAVKNLIASIQKDLPSQGISPASSPPSESFESVLSKAQNQPDLVTGGPELEETDFQQKRLDLAAKISDKILEARNSSDYQQTMQELHDLQDEYAKVNEQAREVAERGVREVFARLSSPASDTLASIKMGGKTGRFAGAQKAAPAEAEIPQKHSKTAAKISPSKTEPWQEVALPPEAPTDEAHPERCSDFDGKDLNSCGPDLKSSPSPAEHLHSNINDPMNDSLLNSFATFAPATSEFTTGAPAQAFGPSSAPSGDIWGGGAAPADLAGYSTTLNSSASSSASSSSSGAVWGQSPESLSDISPYVNVSAPGSSGNPSSLGNISVPAASSSTSVTSGTPTEGPFAPAGVSPSSAPPAPVAPASAPAGTPVSLPMNPTNISPSSAPASNPTSVGIPAVSPSTPASVPPPPSGGTNVSPAVLPSDSSPGTPVSNAAGGHILLGSDAIPKGTSFGRPGASPGGRFVGPSSGGIGVPAPVQGTINNGQIYWGGMSQNYNLPQPQQSPTPVPMPAPVTQSVPAAPPATPIFSSALEHQKNQAPVAPPVAPLPKPVIIAPPPNIPAIPLTVPVNHSNSTPAPKPVNTVNTAPPSTPHPMFKTETFHHAFAEPPADLSKTIAAENAFSANTAALEGPSNSFGVSQGVWETIQKDTNLKSALASLPENAVALYRETPGDLKLQFLDHVKGETRVLWYTISHRRAFVDGQALGRNTFDYLLGSLNDKAQELMKTGKISADALALQQTGLGILKSLDPSQREAYVSLLEAEAAANPAG